MKILLEDVQFWIDNKTFSYEEIAIRFHHRLVSIHPFVNGNGRISRIMADLIMQKFNLKKFVWGNCNLSEISVVRKKYILALQLADKGDYSKLLEFVK